MTAASTAIEDPQIAPRSDQARRTRRPSAWSDRVYWGILYGAAILFAFVCLAFLVTLVAQSLPGWRHTGIGLLWHSTWDPVNSQYGALPLIVGTLETSALALLFAVPIGIAVALAIVHLIPSALRTPLSALVELLATVPSVIYGIIGVIVLAPYCQNHLFPWLNSITHNFVLFSDVTSGQSVLLAGMVLFVMVLPTIVSLSRDAIAAVPHDQVEGALSVGATKWQTLYRVVLPSARVGITGAVTLGAARALGETIAVLFIVGGSFTISASLFAHGNTIAATIATTWDDSTALTKSVLCSLALILIAITATLNYAGSRLLARSRKGAGA